ncbi:MAG TPA: hypothetical protein GXZ90_09040 [Clostridiales bacterium]|nr:hypothetical protein [Clostridiales bacterium]
MNKVNSEEEGVANNDYVELSNQGQQEYKQTLDTIYESMGLNIFDIKHKSID